MREEGPPIIAGNAILVQSSGTLPAFVISAAGDIRSVGSFVANGLSVPDTSVRQSIMNAKLVGSIYLSMISHLSLDRYALAYDPSTGFVVPQAADDIYLRVS